MVKDANIPNPDPSTLTTAQIAREQLALRELLEARIDCFDEDSKLVREIIETRLDGMDKAIKLLQDTTDRLPARIDEKILSLKDVHGEMFKAQLDLMNEKFSSVQKQFEERDARTEQAAIAVKIAVDAALQAQKEAASEQSKSNAAATTKSEASTTKLIDALGATITTVTKGFDDKISDVKDRVNRIEGGWGGASQVIGYVIAAVGVLIGLSRFVK